MIRTRTLLSVLLGASLSWAAPAFAQSDPLPSWGDTPAKASIVAFVEKVTRAGSSDFVPVAERIATFDNDGTLWCEQPVPVQLFFAVDRVKALAPEHPEWKTQEPFESFTFSPAGAAIYQLGNFGTARKKLKEWELKP